MGIIKGIFLKSLVGENIIVLLIENRIGSFGVQLVKVQDGFEEPPKVVEKIEVFNLEEVY